MMVLARKARKGIEQGVRDRDHSRILRAVSLLVVLMMIATRSFAGGLLVTWDPNSESDLAGYRIYYGVEQSVYTQMIDVGNVTSYTIGNLQEGVTYFLVVTAYDLNGNESLPSAEISATVTAAEIYVALDDEGVQLRWTALSGATLYRIYTSSNPYFVEQTAAAELAATTYTDVVNYKTAPFGRYYVVKAFAGETLLHTFDRVGVFSKGLRKGQNLISMPLVPMDNSLNAVLGTQLNGAGNAGQSDKVLYWNGTDYEIAWLVEGTNTAYDGKWMTQAGDQESSLRLDPDRSFWVMLRSTSIDTVLTFTGKVSKDADREITLVQGPNFIGSCYPVSRTLVQSELAADGVAVGGSSSGKSDKIMRWLGTRYEVAWLVGGTGTAYDGTWLNESGFGTTAIQFNPGSGYILWIKGNNASKSWTYPNPWSN
jgi:hypothetical protein